MKKQNKTKENKCFINSNLMMLIVVIILLILIVVSIITLNRVMSLENKLDDVEQITGMISRQITIYERQTDEIVGVGGQTLLEKEDDPKTK